MKKIIYFIPAIIFTTIFVYITSQWGTGGMSPIVLLWIGLFIASGVLLSKKVYFGTLVGLLPAIHMFYMSTKNTGQAISEVPFALAVTIFYLGCGVSVFYSNRKAKN